jgi:hypothetical protein
VGAVPVVVVDPVWQCLGAVSMGAVAEAVAPFAGHRLVEALDLSVGARPCGPRRPSIADDLVDLSHTGVDCSHPDGRRETHLGNARGNQVSMVIAARVYCAPLSGDGL